LVVVAEVCVVLPRWLPEWVAHRQSQVAPAVVIAAPGNGEDPPGLLEGGGQDERRDRECALMPDDPVDVGPGGVEERPVGSVIVEPVECALDEVAVVGRWAADLLNVVIGEADRLVDQRCSGDDSGKRQKVVRGYAVAERFERVGHHTAAGKGVERGGAADLRERLDEVGDQAVLRAHVTQAWKAGRARHRAGHGERLGRGPHHDTLTVSTAGTSRVRPTPAPRTASSALVSVTTASSPTSAAAAWQRAGPPRARGLENARATSVARVPYATDSRPPAIRFRDPAGASGCRERQAEGGPR